MISLVAALALAFGIPRPIIEKLATINPQLAAKLPRGMGSEFMPPLNEGSLLFMPVLLPDVRSRRSNASWRGRTQVIKQTPEVESVAGKLGRADTATDPAPVQMIETTIMLKPKSHWRPGMTKDKLIAELDGKIFARCPATFPVFSSRLKTGF